MGRILEIDAGRKLFFNCEPRDAHASILCHLFPLVDHNVPYRESQPTHAVSALDSEVRQSYDEPAHASAVICGGSTRSAPAKRRSIQVEIRLV